ncbi:Holliday junction resolvase RuvX [Candidatus Saccharibacteria bacterium]|nr:Holliday junction resolvase RuvX [Candidatus Saccharibacteria bacterium]
MQESNIIALDIGEKRIGIAIASVVAGFPTPLITIENNDKVWHKLHDIIGKNEITSIVVGLPVSLSGNETAQTKYTRLFVDELSKHFSLPIHFQDESLTSKKAESELEAKKKSYSKADIDALAATFILDDFLAERGH